MCLFVCARVGIMYISAYVCMHVWMYVRHRNCRTQQSLMNVDEVVYLHIWPKGYGQCSCSACSPLKTQFKGGLLQPAQSWPGGSAGTEAMSRGHLLPQAGPRHGHRTGDGHGTAWGLNGQPGHIGHTLQQGEGRQWAVIITSLSANFAKFWFAVQFLRPELSGLGLGLL